MTNKNAGIGYDIGSVRHLNEDSLANIVIDSMFGKQKLSLLLAVVADGMGGHKYGEVASKYAVSYFIRYSVEKIIKAAQEQDEMNFKLENPSIYQDILSSAMAETNKLIWAKSQGNGMGTTVVAALIDGPSLYVINVGDSRCYIINAKGITQVTRDHSLVQQMVDANSITQAQSRIHPRKNVITRVVGHYDEVQGDMFHKIISRGDRVLLCSDGLWGAVPDEEIANLVRTARSPQAACNMLVDKAKSNGGLDNISAIIIKPVISRSRQRLVAGQ